MIIIADIREQEYINFMRIMQQNMAPTIFPILAASIIFCAGASLILNNLVFDERPEGFSIILISGVLTGLLIEKSVNLYRFRKILNKGHYNIGETKYELNDTGLIIHGCDVAMTLPYHRIHNIHLSENVNCIVHGMFGFILPNKENLISGDLEEFLHQLQSKIDLREN